MTSPDAPSAPSAELGSAPSPAVGEGSGALIVRNTIANALGSGAGILTTLLLTPVMINKLGGAAFGVWTLATTLTFSGYLSLTDLGAQQAAVRAVADARSRRDAVSVSGIYSTTLALFVAIPIVIVPVLVAVAPAIVGVFAVNPDMTDEATLTFQLVAASLALDLPAMAPRAVLEGAQRFVLIRLLDLVRAVGFAFATVLLLTSGFGIVALGLAFLASSAFSAVSFVLAARFAEPDGRLRLALVTRERLLELMRFGGALFVLRIVSVIYRQMDRVIVGIVLSVALVTRYEIASKIQAALAVVVSITSSALLPAAAFIRAEPARLRDLYLRGTCYTIALTVPLSVAVMLFARPIVTGWLGERWSSAVGLTRLFVVWIALSALSTVGWTILVALGRLRPLLVLNVGWLALNLGLSIALVYPLGVAGVIWGTLISTALLTFAYTRLFLAELEVTPSEWLRRTIVPNLPGLVAQLALGLPLLFVVDGLPDVAAAVIGVLVSSAASLAAFLFVGLDGVERAYVFGMLRAAGKIRSARPAVTGEPLP